MTFARNGGALAAGERLARGGLRRKSPRCVIGRQPCALPSRTERPNLRETGERRPDQPRVIVRHGPEPRKMRRRDSGLQRLDRTLKPWRDCPKGLQPPRPQRGTLFVEQRLETRHPAAGLTEASHAPSRATRARKMPSASPMPPRSANRRACSWFRKDEN